MALASTGHRAWAYPRDDFVLVVVSDLARRAVHVGVPFFDAKALEHPDDTVEPPAEPVGADADSRMVDVQRIELSEVLARSWAPGSHRVWLLCHDWCSNACDVEVPGTPTPAIAIPVAPTPTDGTITFARPQTPQVPDAPGIALQIDPQPGSVRLSAALHVQAEPVHIPSPALAVTETNGHDYPIAAVIPCTLILASAAGGAPQVLQMGVAAYGPLAQLGQTVHAGFILELTKVFGFGDKEQLLWACVDGVLSGPVVIP